MSQAVPHLLLAIDFGASATKAIGSIIGRSNCMTLAMSPHCVKVEDDSLLTSDPDFNEHESWVKIAGISYALGNLATTRFNSSLKVKPLKFTSAVPKACAVISIFAQKLQLPPKFELSLTFVLPPAEWERKQIVADRLQIALKDLVAPNGRIKPKLLSLAPVPEGMGVLLGQDFDTKRMATITVVMVGFRNASMFVANYGIVNLPQTSNLGFHDLLKDIAGRTGYRIDKLIQPTFEYVQSQTEVIKSSQQLVECERKLKDFSGFDYDRREQLRTDLELYRQQIDRAKVTLDRVFDPLLRNSGQDRVTEIEMLTEAIDRGNSTYLVRLKDWLDEMMPSSSDHILLCGGTTEYLGAEFRLFLQDKILGANSQNLHLHLATRIPNQITALDVSQERFADIYSLWQRMNGRLNSDLAGQINE